MAVAVLYVPSVLKVIIFIGWELLLYTCSLNVMLMGLCFVPTFRYLVFKSINFFINSVYTLVSYKSGKHLYGILVIDRVMISYD